MGVQNSNFASKCSSKSELSASNFVFRKNREAEIGGQLLYLHPATTLRRWRYTEWLRKNWNITRYIRRSNDRTVMQTIIHYLWSEG